MTDKIVSHAIEQGIDFLFANRFSGLLTLGSTVAFHRSPVDHSQRRPPEREGLQRSPISDPEKNGKGQVIPANGSIPANYLRLLDVTDQINDPKQNVIDQSHGNTGLMMAYALNLVLEGQTIIPSAISDSAIWVVVDICTLHLQR